MKKVSFYYGVFHRSCYGPCINPGVCTTDDTEFLFIYFRGVRFTLLPLVTHWSSRGVGVVFVRMSVCVYVCISACVNAPWTHTEVCQFTLGSGRFRLNV